MAGTTIHWVPQDDGTLGCAVTTCACTVAPTSLCAKCGAGFVPPIRHPEVILCYPCSEQDSRDDDERAFAPLTDALKAAGIDSDVANTGGNVMCLWVDLPAVTLPGGATHRPYILFSDEAESGGCGAYIGMDTQGFSLWPTAPWEKTFDQPPQGWHALDPVTHKRYGTLTGEWFAAIWPALLQWVAESVTWHDNGVEWSALPVLANTEVLEQ